MNLKTTQYNPQKLFPGLFTFILAIFLVSGSVIAQKAKEFDKDFEKAMEEFEEGRYDAAIMSLSPLSLPHENNSHDIEARYLKALCRFKKGNLDIAFQEFTQLLNNFPKWERAEDVNYMLGNIAFENEDYLGAMVYLANCQSERISGDVFNMKRFYLLQIKNFNMMRALYARYGDDDAVSMVYLERLSSRKFLWPYERDQLNYLKQTFDQDKEILKQIKELENKGKKGVYNVAALLPLEYDNLKTFKTRPSNQFVIDLYNGLDMAIQELDTMHQDSVRINLRTYDTRNDSATIDSILKLEEFSNIDLIFGPIYKTEHEVVEPYSNMNKICKINPLSKVPEDADSAFGLYFETSMENLAIRAAEFCFDSLTTDSVFIAAYKNPKDTEFVQAFTARFDSLGGKKPKVYYFNKYDQILTMMGKMNIDTSTIKAIIVCNGNSKIVSNVCSYYTVRRLEVPLLTVYDFVKSDQFLIRSFNYTDLYVLHPDYYEDTAQVKFFDNYLGRYMYPPSKHSMIGYEMGYFFGKQLVNYGKYFANTISVNESLIPGKMRPYFNYYNSSSNTFVPIMKMKDYQLVPINFPEREKKQGMQPEDDPDPDFNKYIKDKEDNNDEGSDF